jgi:hypothetical protein
MTTRIAAAVLMLVLMAAAQTNPQSQKPASPDKPSTLAQRELSPALFKAFGNYGGWWNRISETEKDSFLDGFMTAMARANSLMVSMCKSIMKEAQPGAANFNEKLNGGLDLCMVGETFAYSPDKPLKPRLDDFYKDPLNMRIPVQFALEHIRDEVSGKKTAGQLLDELNEWRKILNGGKN